MTKFEFFEKFPFMAYPLFMVKSGFVVLKAALYIAYQSVIKGRNMFLTAPIKDTQRNLPKETMEGRPGAYKLALWAALFPGVLYYANLYKRYARDPGSLIWHEDLIMPEILIAMGLNSFLVEGPGIMAPISAPDETHELIDVMENAGYPGDICTLPKTTLGMVLSDRFPPPKAIVTSNSPCDGGMSSYLPMEQKTGAPTFRLDLPWDVYPPRAQEYCQKEIWRMIHFLEEQTGRTLEMDKLRQICERRNQTLELTIDFFDMMKEKPAPIGGDALFFSHGVYNMAPGTKFAHKAISDLLDIARFMKKKGRGPVAEEKYRAVLWNPPTAMFPMIYKWLEDTYGMVVVMDMLTFHNSPMIDTSTDETMMRDLTDIMSKGPMGRHTRGPSEYFFDDLFRIYEEFQADVIIMAAHLNCKNTRALLTMFRDFCRRDGIPLMMIDYDLSDARVVSIDGIKRQVADFMDNVMGEG